MRPGRRVLLCCICAAAAACTPTLDESLVIAADGSGEFTATWFVTREDFDTGGFEGDVGGALANREFGEVQELFRAGRPEDLLIALTGDDAYRAPSRARLDTLVEDDRVGIVYQEPFSSLVQLESWRRGNGPAGSLGGPVDPESGRPSLVALWGLGVDESPDRTTLTIDTAGAFISGRVTELGDDEDVRDVRIRLTVAVDGEVIDDNADRVDGDRYVWEPTIAGLTTDQIAALEPARLTWRRVAEPEDDSGTTTIALALIGVGAAIAVMALGRFAWTRLISQPPRYDDG